MLLPLFGFIFGVASSASLGAVVIALHPRWKLTLRNIACFVVGAFAAVISSGVLYGWLFADNKQQLQTGVLVMGLLMTLASATLLGGMAGTSLGQRYCKPDA